MVAVDLGMEMVVVDLALVAVEVKAVADWEVVSGRAAEVWAEEVDQDSAVEGAVKGAAGAAVGAAEVEDQATEVVAAVEAEAGVMEAAEAAATAAAAEGLAQSRRRASRARGCFASIADGAERAEGGV